MKKILSCCLLVILSQVCFSQQTEPDEDILFISGAETMEELDEEVTGRFYILERHPIRINSANLSRLASCGLFTKYQAASICDYRARNGDILSIHELGTVDGIGPAMARALRRFISLEPGKAGSKVREYSMTGRMIARRDGTGNPEDQYGAKFHYDDGGRMELNWAGRTTYDNDQMSPGMISSGIYGRRGKLVIGDFNARFGQGLCLWNGFSLSGFGSASSFRKNGTGLSATSSFSGAFRGIGADCSIGRWTSSAALAIPGLRNRMDGKDTRLGLMPMINLSRLGRNFHAGITGWCEFEGGMGPFCLSADGKIGLGPVELFGEAAIQRNAVAGAITGLMWAAGYGSRLCAVARYYPPSFDSSHSNAAGTGSGGKDETGASLGWFSKFWTAAMDASWKPQKGTHNLKAAVCAKPAMELDGLSLKGEFRLSSRLRAEESPRFRNEMRASISAEKGLLYASGRCDLVRCRNWAALGYLESGIRQKDGRFSFSAFLRAAIFNIGHWDDRIYVYERDIPGSFNVPAYYGKGWNVSITSGAGWKGERFTHGINLRLAYTDYPWTSGKKSRGEMHVHYSLKFRYGLFHLDSPGSLDKHKRTGYL